ncbi:MAG: adenylate kinase [Actinobacteria bacterium]|nr:adenylate kinase [Actinomycetota bacterium]
MALDIVILGPPGAGKGTQAKRISEDTGLPHINTGDIIRTEIKAGTPFGQTVRSYNDRGELVPDEIIIGRVRERLDEGDTAAGFVLDGFPRTMPQAEALDGMLDEIGREISLVLHFMLPEEMAEQRLLRRASEQSRSDDTPDVIHRRMELQRVPEELVAYYRTKGILVGIHADRTIDEVFAEVQSVLETTAAR